MGISKSSYRIVWEAHTGDFLDTMENARKYTEIQRHAKEKGGAPVGGWGVGGCPLFFISLNFCFCEFPGMFRCI